MNLSHVMWLFLSSQLVFYKFQSLKEYVTNISLGILQQLFTWDLSLMQYSCIIHSVLSPLGARPKWNTNVLFVPITLEPDFTLRSLPVAFQYPHSVALLLCEPFGYFLPRGEKKNHSLSDWMNDLAGFKPVLYQQVKSIGGRFKHA